MRWWGHDLLVPGVGRAQLQLDIGGDRVVGRQAGAAVHRALGTVNQALRASFHQIGGKQLFISDITCR